MATKACSSPMLYFNCANGFSGCCVNDPCDQSEPSCPCYEQQPVQSALPAVAVSVAEPSMYNNPVASTTDILSSELFTTTTNGIIAIAISTTSSGIKASPTGPSATISAISSTSIALPAPTNSHQITDSSNTGLRIPIAGGVFAGIAGIIGVLGILGLAFWCLRSEYKKFKIRRRRRHLEDGSRWVINVVEQVNVAPASDVTGPSSRVASPVLLHRLSPTFLRDGWRIGSANR